MAISIPKLHDFDHPTKIYDLRAHKCCIGIGKWEIGVPHSDDLLWSIVLCYLISTDFKQPDDFRKRLNTLTSTDSNWRAVKSCICHFNPFRNRHSCFFDKALGNVLDQFKGRFSGNLSDIDSKLEAASELLKSAILKISYCNDSYTFRSFGDEYKESANNITLFVSSQSTEKTEIHVSRRRVSFGLERKLGFRLKKAALRYILSKAEIHKRDINKIVALMDHEQNFLVTVLKNMSENFISRLYNSPYIPKKLEEAGYQTDPRIVDSEGLSAFYHAAYLGNKAVLYTLYDYAADACYECDHTIRDPNSTIVSNLQNLDEILLKDLNTSKEFEMCSKRHHVQTTFHGLQRVNKFLVKVSSGILKIRQKINYYDRVSEEVSKATQQKDIILCILEAYDEYFFAEDESEKSSPLDDYKKHQTYYYVLDTSACVLFFDNIILLKEKLSLNHDCYGKFESQFFWTVMAHDVFDNSKHNIPKGIEDVEINNAYSLIPLLERLDLRISVHNFSDTLRNKEVKDAGILSRVPETEILHTLNDYPDIKDSLLVFRLKHYMVSALDIKVTDLKSVLVVERALQVLGESLTPSEINISNLFKACLPEKTVRTLQNLRDELSHFDSPIFPLKFQAEQNYSHFRGIQSEMNKIYRVFSILFRLQRLKTTQFIFNRAQKNLQRAANTDSGWLVNNAVFEQQLKKGSETLEVLLKVFQRVRGMQTAYALNKRKCECQIIFKNVINEAERKINEKFWTKPLEFIIKDVQNLLRSIQYLVELLRFSKIKDEKTFSAVIYHKKATENPGTVENLKFETLEYISCVKDLFATFDIVATGFGKKKYSKLNEITSDNIDKLKNILRGQIYITEDDKNKIRDEIPPSVKQNKVMKEKLISSLENDGCLDPQVQVAKFQNLYLTNSEYKQLKIFCQTDPLKAANIIKSSKDPIDELESVFKNNMVSGSRYAVLCKRLSLTEESKRKLSVLIEGQRKKSPEDELHFFLNRVQELQSIVIEESPEIRELFYKAKNKKAKMHGKHKIVRRYLWDSSVMASTELLLFDCMTIFEKKKNSKDIQQMDRRNIADLWIKVSSLYSGINLRHVMAHGSPLLEKLVSLLDPEDLAFALVDKMLQLIENKDIIVALIELRDTAECGYHEFHKIMNDEKNTQYKNLKDRILSKGDIWKAYSSLIPLIYENYSQKAE